MNNLPFSLAPNAGCPPAFSQRFTNLADARLGACVVAVSDDFFAPCERMLNPEPARFYAGVFDDNGKWMDGWESRRKRVLGHDWSIIKLAGAGRLYGVDLDTSFFTGNFPPAASVQAIFSPHQEPNAHDDWQTLIEPTSLQGNQHHFIEIDSSYAFTHVRVNIFPDGGIARLRVYGQIQRVLDDTGADVNLIALMNGARAIAHSDAHYGTPSNLLHDGRGVNMGDGWETRRRREPGHDWCIIALGQAGYVDSIEVDTAHFKGNFPAGCSIQAAYVNASTDASLITQSMFWPILLSEQALTADAIHHFVPSSDLGKISHVRFNILPDGGVSRLRLLGRWVSE